MSRSAQTRVLIACLLACVVSVPFYGSVLAQDTTLDTNDQIILPAPGTPDPQAPIESTTGETAVDAALEVSTQSATSQELPLTVEPFRVGPEITEFAVPKVDGALLAEYTAAIEAYQESVKNYSLKKKQWQQVDTLAALEETVIAARVALEKQDEMILVYLKIIDSMVQPVITLPQEKKDAILARSAQVQEQIRAHLELTKQATDRAAVEAASAAFTLILPQLEKVGYTTQSYLLLARVRLLHTHARYLLTTITLIADQSQMPEDKRAVFDRGVREVAGVLEQLNTQLIDVEMRIDQDLERTISFKTQTGRIQQLLSPVYVELRKMPDFLMELVRQLPSDSYSWSDREHHDS